MDFARSTGARGWRMFLKIRLPQALPDIFTGLKVGAALSATAAVVAEFVAADKGLGYLLQQYNGQLETPMVFAIIVLLSLIGLVVYYAVELIERLVIPWHVSQRPREGPAFVKTNSKRATNQGEDHMTTKRSFLPLTAAAHGRSRSRLPAQQLEPVSLRLNWYIGGLHVPFYYGKERGFFRDEGIDLTINEGRGSANTVQVVAAGSDTFGMADSSGVIGLRRRAPKSSR